MRDNFGHSLLQQIFDIATGEYNNNPSNMSWFTVKGYAEALIELTKENDNG